MQENIQNGKVGGKMARCKKCNVEILDDTDRCPLCNLILEKNDTPISNLYPIDAIEITRRFRVFSNILLFLSIVLQTFCFWLDYSINGRKIMWSIIVGMVVVYVNVILRLTIMGKSGYLFKIVGICFIALGMCVCSDFVMAYKGWSLEYVFPIVILVLDLIIVILMLANRRNWQSYIMIQLFQVVLGVVLVTLGVFGEIKWVVLINVSTAVSIFLFLGTVIIGDKRAKTELKRRFHI